MSFDQLADYLRSHGLDKEHREYPEGGVALLHPGYIVVLCGRCRASFTRARNQTHITDCGQCDRALAEGGVR